MTAIVLAGGRGTRMKADKAGLVVGGRTLLEHVLAQIGPYFDEVLVSVSPGQGIALSRGPRTRSSRRPASPAHGQILVFKVVPDETRGLGPIGGVLSGLKAARNDACAVIACDIPDIDIALLRSLARAAREVEIAVPLYPVGHHEPLFAVYKRSVAGTIETLLSRGERCLLDLYRGCRTAIVRLDEKRRLRNLNTRADYESYIRTIDDE